MTGRFSRWMSRLHQACSFCICTLYSWQQLGSLGGSFHTNSNITFRWWNSHFLCVRGFQQEMTDWLTAAGLWSGWAGTDTCWCHYTTDFCLLGGGGLPCCERHVLLCHSSGWKLLRNLQSVRKLKLSALWLHQMKLVPPWSCQCRKLPSVAVSELISFF